MMFKAACSWVDDPYLAYSVFFRLLEDGWSLPVIYQVNKKSLDKSLRTWSLVWDITELGTWGVREVMIILYQEARFLISYSAYLILSCKFRELRPKNEKLALEKVISKVSRSWRDPEAVDTC